VIGRRALLAGAGAVLAGRAGAEGLITPPSPSSSVPLAATPISRMETRWWRERHAASLRAIRARRVDLVLLGDSITQNWEKSGPPAWQDFHPAWDRFYGDRHALNLGFSGDATCHLLWRLRNGEIDGIAPKAAVILIGANNLGRLHWSASDTLAGIAAVVDETRRRLPGMAILLLGILPSERTAWASEVTTAVNLGLARRYVGGAVQRVSYLDLAGVFAPGGRLDRTLYYDPLLTPPEAPLHPSAEGQSRMALAIEPVLAPMLGGSPRLG
jgi:lysophospholipase L1-like esterase